MRINTLDSGNSEPAALMLGQLKTLVSLLGSVSDSFS